MTPRPPQGQPVVAFGGDTDGFVSDAVKTLRERLHLAAAPN